MRGDLPQRVQPGGHRLDGVARVGQGMGERAAHHRVILNQQHEGHGGTVVDIGSMSAMAFWRSPGTGALAWLVATTLGVAVAWVGLRPVLDAAVPDRAAPLSAADVQRLAVPSAAMVRQPAPSASGSAAAPSSPTSAPASPSPRRSSQAPLSPAPVVIDGWTVTTQADGTVSYLRGFQVSGGSTVIRMTPGRVHLVSATPGPSYSVETNQSDPTRVVVQFTASGTYDIVDAMWWNDRPYAQVSHVG